MTYTYLQNKSNFCRIPPNYYPFGMEMPGRTFNSQSYTYGFNGKIKDNEISQGDLDFGARIYDSKIGRWLSTDPLQVKYPSLSPYNFCNNSPIVYVDSDGKDYGVYINPSNNTITIKATIYTNSSDTKDATNAAMQWNNQSGKYKVKLGDGENAVKYTVNFEITVVDKGTDVDRDNAYLADNSGMANTFAIASNLGSNNGITEDPNDPSKPDYTRGSSKISVVTGKQTQRKTGSHEIGHILGLGHFTKGLMKAGNDRKDSETNITKGVVKEILNHAGVNFKKSSFSISSDYQNENPNGSANSSVTNTNENKPKSEPGTLNKGI